MQYRNLGTSGLKLSVIGLGTMQWRWRTTEQEALNIMDAFLDYGGNFLDTANIYSKWVPELEAGSSETVIGQWLHDRGCRDRVVLATKVRGDMSSRTTDQGLSRHHIMNAIDESLRRLQTDYVDLYQLHWSDPETPIEETLSALDDLIRRGKVRYIGCSNFQAWQLVEALWCSDKHNLHSFVSLQPHYNLVHRAEYETELAQVCTRFGVGVVPYSPMAGGFLTGKYRPDAIPDTPRAGSVSSNYLRAENWKILDMLTQIAENRNTWPGAVALAWLLAQPAVVSPIAGANSVSQLQANLTAVDLDLTADELNQLTEASNALPSE